MTVAGSSAIEFYRKYPRAVQALHVSGRFKGEPSASAVASFVSSSPELRELVARIRSFNIFSALGIDEKEVRRSRILAWLLSPDGSHGHGDRYLRRFLVSAGLRVEAADLSRTEVGCEDDRIDILILDPLNRTVCAVENKIRAVQRERQLTDYREALERRFPEYVRAYVFLTLNQEPPADPFWKSLDYETLVEQVIGYSTSQLDASPEAAMAILVSHYRAVIDPKRSFSRINVLDVLNIRSRELKHSDFIAWLLRPDASHKLKDRFAQFLLNLAVSKMDSRPTQSLQGVSLDDLIVSRERESIDIFAISESNRIALVIENKLRAKEHGIQLANYRNFVCRHYRGDTLIYIFLDSKAARASQPEYVNVSYAELLPFFDQLAMNLSVPDEEQTIALILEHYCALLADHLWIKRRETWLLPARLQQLCDRIAKTDSPAAAALLGDVRTWQISTFKQLEPILFELADQFLGPCAVKNRWDEWLRFIPAAIDEIKPLRTGGADQVVGGRLLVYEFFVVPFGSAKSRRKPGISIDIKLFPAKAEFDGLKQRLHQAARTETLFNRRTVPCGKRVPMLNYHLLTFDEAVRCSFQELTERLTNRIRRFADSIHPDVVAFAKQVVEKSA